MQGGKYIAAAGAAVLIGVVVGQLAAGGDVGFSQEEGISVFAVLYVLAQGVERVVEFTVIVVDLLAAKVGATFAEARKRTAAASIRAALQAGAPPAPTDVVEARESRADLAVLAGGLGFGLAYALVGYLGVGILSIIGVHDLMPWMDRAFTALAIGGGSKGLHELVGRLQKTKEAAAGA
jgi:hypothetical protein